MQTFKISRVLKYSAIPFLFSVSAVGLAAVHVTTLKKAEQARLRTAQAVALQANPLLDGTLRLKIRDLVSAAGAGDLPAQLEIGRRFAEGFGVKKNPARAAIYFQMVVDGYGSIGARDKRGPLVATALRYLAEMYRNGVVDAKITANPAYAFNLLHHAASYFGDPASQTELAKLLMSGEGVAKNTRAAAQWLLSASRKGYPPAQALLGGLLWHGEGVKRVAGDGLGLLAMARKSALPDDKAWIGKMFEAARAEASPMEILEANAFIVQESGTAHSNVANDILINGEQDGQAASAAGLRGGDLKPATTPGDEQATGRQGLLIQGPPSASPNTAGGAVVGSTGADAGLVAGIPQMYRPSSSGSLIETSSPVRLAGASR